jgi:hypothetical protein
VFAGPRSPDDAKLPTSARPGWRFGQLLAAALLVFGAANDSEASCGDYVAVGSGQLMAADHTHPSSADDLPLAPLARCRGPNCQRQAPPPTGPSRDLPTVRSSERALCPVLFQPPPLAPNWFADGAAKRPLDGHAQPIEHPPRWRG